MPIHYEIETDALYLKGYEDGRKIRLVLDFSQKGMDTTKISFILDLTTEKVEQILAKYQNKNVDKTAKK